MIVIAGYCASRLVVSYRWRRETAVDADGTHVLMGVAMAGMLAPRLNPGWNGILVVVFGVAATWFTRQTANVWRGSAVRGAHCASPAPHLLECAAMLYMLLAGSAPMTEGQGLRTSMGGASVPAVAAGHFPVVAVALALMLFGTGRHSLGQTPSTTLVCAGVTCVCSSWQPRLPDLSYASPAPDIVSEDKSGSALAWFFLPS